MNTYVEDDSVVELCPAAGFASGLTPWKENYES